MTADLLPLWFIVGFSAVFGALFGSFLNVVVYRVPAGESLMGRSHCPKCSHPIRAYDNIPVLSWFILLGKCRDCKEGIAWRYPAVEAFTAIAFGAIAAWQGQVSFLLLLLFIYAFVSIALTLIDIDTMRLPDAIVLPATITLSVGLIINSVITADYSSLLRAAIAGVVMTLLYGAVWFFSGGRGLGYGDVKMAFMLGIMTGYFSWDAAIIAFIAAWITGGLFAIAALLAGKVKRGMQIPFGPFLILGTWIGIVGGSTIVNWYLDIMGIG